MHQARWVAVTKMRSLETLQALYQTGKRQFGENKAQELCDKYVALPKDIEWHFIGHLQTNKVKSIIDKVSFIHSVDSRKLLDTIQREAKAVSKNISIFIQIHIAEEETKYGFSLEEVIDFFSKFKKEDFPNIHIVGLMAMASLTDNQAQIKNEFLSVKKLKDTINTQFQLELKEISMGMSGDYEIALECGATYIRIGSILFE